MKLATHMESHLLQMRGLKLDQGVKYKQVGIVASFTDAWIETDREPPSDF